MTDRIRALVLGGGGAKGAYQAGALWHLMGVLGRDYEIICGTSVGAINAAYLSQIEIGKPADSAEKLLGLWNIVNNSKVKKRWFPFGVLSALWKQSVYNSTPLQQWIRSGLLTSDIAKSGHKLRIVSVSFDSGEIFVADENTPDLEDWVIASAAFPIMLNPVVINNQLWTDGGLRRVTPLGEAIRLGATEIDVIMCSNPWEVSALFDSKSAKALPGLLLRAVDILSNEVSRADLEIAGLKNDLADLDSKYRKVKINVLQPSVKLTDDSLDFSQENIQRMIKIGLADAQIFTKDEKL